MTKTNRMSRATRAALSGGTRSVRQPTGPQIARQRKPRACRGLQGDFHETSRDQGALDPPDTIPRHKSRKARIEAPKREAQSSPAAHRGARVIGADPLRIVLISPDPSDGQECNQDNEDNPNINAHQSSPAAGSVPRAIDAGQCCRSQQAS